MGLRARLNRVIERLDALERREQNRRSPGFDYCSPAERVRVDIGGRLNVLEREIARLKDPEGTKEKNDLFERGVKEGLRMAKDRLDGPPPLGGGAGGAASGYARGGTGNPLRV